MNIRSFLVASILLLTSTISFGQKSSDMVSEVICRCLEKRIPNTKNTHLKDSVNKCFGQGMATDMEGLSKEYNVNKEIISVEGLMLIRDGLLIRLKRNCKEFKKIASKLY